MRHLHILLIIYVCCIASAYGQTPTLATAVPRECVAETPALTVVATDALGQLYRLRGSIGMERRLPDNWAPETWGTFLTLPADFPTRATFIFKTEKPAATKTPMSFSAEMKIGTDVKQRTFTTTTISFLGVTPEGKSGMR